MIEKYDEELALYELLELDDGEVDLDIDDGIQAVLAT